MKKVFAAAIATLIFSTSALACTKPDAPVLPDPSTAVTPQMIKAKNEVNAYLEAAKAYLDCVSGNASRHNAMVEEMEKVADKFNTAVREYKARMSAA